MIELAKGDLFASDAEAFVNAVNCVGVMGGGIALAFKRAYPANFVAYAAACERGEVRTGRMFVFDAGAGAQPRYIVNFPTLSDWTEGATLAILESGLAALAEEIRSRGIRSIAIPALGCGIGGLAWAEVRPRIEAALAGLDGVRVVLYRPGE